MNVWRWRALKDAAGTVSQRAAPSGKPTAAQHKVPVRSLLNSDEPTQVRYCCY
jgi:hypothetical protein